jgi:hypothetical protein
MPWNTHRPEGELGKIPISSNQFFLVYQLVMGIAFFCYFYQTIRKNKGSFDDDLKNKQAKYSAKKTYFKR